MKDTSKLLLTGIISGIAGALVSAKICSDIDEKHIDDLEAENKKSYETLLNQTFELSDSESKLTCENYQLRREILELRSRIKCIKNDAKIGGVKIDDESIDFPEELVDEKEPEIPEEIIPENVSDEN